MLPATSGKIDAGFHAGSPSNGSAQYSADVLTRVGLKPYVVDASTAPLPRRRPGRGTTRRRRSRVRRQKRGIGGVVLRDHAADPRALPHGIDREARDVAREFDQQSIARAGLVKTTMHFPIARDRRGEREVASVAPAIALKPTIPPPLAEDCTASLALRETRGSRGMVGSLCDVHDATLQRARVRRIGRRMSMRVSRRRSNVREEANHVSLDGAVLYRFEGTVRVCCGVVQP
jgi:hypothetical protein